MEPVNFLAAIAPAMTDPETRAQWLADPHAALLAAGIDVPKWATVTATEGGKLGVAVTLGPLIDVSQELGEEALDGVAGGGCSCYASTA